MKQISSRFSVAVHILSLVAISPEPVTGDFIAGSVNTNPVIIRKVIGMLKKAGLVEVRPGIGGTSLLKDRGEITLLDVYRAVEVIGNGELFHVHDDPNPDCPVGKHIEAALRHELQEAQAALEARLARVSLERLVTRFH